jgi:hypothetical protein
MKFIMTGGMARRKDSKIVTGTPDNLADRIFRYLQEKGFIK